MTPDEYATIKRTGDFEKENAREMKKRMLRSHAAVTAEKKVKPAVVPRASPIAAGMKNKGIKVFEIYFSVWFLRI